jgi:hypothetical protein
MRGSMEVVVSCVIIHRQAFHAVTEEECEKYHSACTKNELAISVIQTRSVNQAATTFSSTLIAKKAAPVFVLPFYVE